MSNRENRKDKGFGEGVALIVIGVLFTLMTVFDFDIDWHIMSKLWPLLLIIIGVCVMPINKWIKLVVTVALLALGVVAYQQKTDINTKVIKKTEIRNKKHKKVEKTTIYRDDDND